MPRRAALALLALAGAGLALPVVSGCGSSSLDLAKVDVDRQPADAEPDHATTAALGTFAGALLAPLSGAADTGNVICSPLSVQAALAMTRNGAAGATAAEMDAALRFPDLAELNQGLNTTLQLLTGRSGKKSAGDRTGEVILAIADQVFGQKSFSWHEPFLTALARFYGTGVAESDFTGDAEGCRKVINSWAEDQTHDKITDLVPQGAITAETRMVLANALYLKAPWLEPFDDARPGEFTKEDGKKVDAKLMHAGYSGRAASGKGWQAAEIPYLGGDLAMTVILPEKIGAARSQLSDGLISTVLSALQEGYQVSLTMPKFSFRTTAQLSETLSQLGMPTAFTDDADFSGLTDDQALKIDKVLHQGWIAVDEQGTEAAAATAVVMKPTSAPADPKRMTLVLDRPFWFVIHDRKLAVPFLVGQVADPAGEA